MKLINNIGSSHSCDVSRVTPSGSELLFPAYIGSNHILTMYKKVCQVCNKSFTRQWNLDRHTQDIHHITKDGENYRVKQKYEGPPYSYPSPFRNEQLRNYENNTIEKGYYENPEYHNFTYNYSSNDLYNNRFYEDFEPVPLDKKENKVTIHDMLRIQHGLKIKKLSNEFILILLFHRRSIG